MQRGRVARGRWPQASTALHASFPTTPAGSAGVDHRGSHLRTRRLGPLSWVSGTLNPEDRDRRETSVSCRETSVRRGSPDPTRPGGQDAAGGIGEGAAAARRREQGPRPRAAGAGTAPGRCAAGAGQAGAGAKWTPARAGAG